jgi:septum formation protein
MTIVLASASPRREELLRQVGCSFSVMPSDVDEDNSEGMPPEELAVSLAAAKASDVAAKLDPDDIVIGADTLVILNGQAYGKPRDMDDARSMLERLSGREHRVVTAIAVVYRKQLWTDYCVTRVKIRTLDRTEIEGYLDTGEPMGKAGAYAIQGVGALLVEGIDGCYANVVGLPLVSLDRLLCRATGKGLL